VSAEKYFFKDGIQKLVKRWQNCFAVRRDYVENDYAQLYIKFKGTLIFLFPLNFSLPSFFIWLEAKLFSLPLNMCSNFCLSTKPATLMAKLKQLVIRTELGELSGIKI
jgi:hypothetical protein